MNENMIVELRRQIILLEASLRETDGELSESKELHKNVLKEMSETYESVIDSIFSGLCVQFPNIDINDLKEKIGAEKQRIQDTYVNKV